MEKVAFIIVPSFSKSKWLNNKLLEVTQAFVNVANIENVQVYEVQTYEDIKHYKNKAEFLVIVGAGNVIMDRDHFWKKLTTIPDDVGLLGNLLQYEGDDLPYLHEQFFIVRSTLLEDLDLSPGSITDHKVSRSKRSMHGNYAPVEVFLDIPIIEQSAGWGTKLILKTLKEGLKVRNFDDDWRYGGNSDFVKSGIPVRGYVYPNKSTEVFEQAHKEFKILPGLDDSQELYINAVLDYRKYNFVNIWSWDPTIQNNNTHTVAVPTTGFLGEITAHYNNASKIIFYDINKNNLDFKQYLYSNWNGENYLEFALAYCNENNLKTEPNTDLDISDAGKFNKDTKEIVFDNWQKFKDLEKEFVHIDLIKEPKTLFDKLPGSSILHTSNMLESNVYPFTSILYDRKEVEYVRHLISLTNIMHYENIMNHE